MSGLPSLRGALLMVAAVLTVTLAAAGVVLLLGEDPFETTTAPQPRTVRRETPALDKLVPTTAPVKDFGQGGAGVTPTPPRVLAIAPGTVPQQARHRLAALKHVQKALVVDAGSVKVSGTGLNLLAVDPADFRSWTPKVVADQPGVWSALARGEVVADSAAMRKYGLTLGAYYQVGGGPRLRVGASAPLGLTGVDGLVGADLGRTLGMAQGVAVLLHGKEGGISEKGVRKVLGKGSQVVMLGTARRTEAKREQPATATAARPGSYLELYKQSATRCPGLSWTVLAAIGQVESGHGRNNGPSSAGALGPMQFMPATWKAYGVDGDGDGERDIWSPYDAVPGAANYLCKTGAGQGGEKLRKAVWHYNHSWDYVNKVLSIAEAYARAYA
ncbi:lytic transglycosylase domain-containing protein [Nonomuraea ceibae]|uniref:lytic transglycosylase domain-containing protein n=1 Tax=Nonomuraea ceibae TaxID=1935170 RepID=UPI0027E0F829|nr:lytic transglycosylase domain-containing protein [Nonomuraea ceibae]